MRRYGHWAGCERGYPEDPERCAAEVPMQSGSALFKQCSRKRGHGPGGEFCRQHAKEVDAGRYVSTGRESAPKPSTGKE